MKLGTTASPANSRLLPIGLALACSLSASAQETAALQRFDFSGPAMGTTFHVAVYAPTKDRAKTTAGTAFHRARTLEQLFSDYEPNSELNQLVRAAPQPLKVSAEMQDLTHQAIRLAQITGGAFDPTCGPLSRLWRRSRHQLTLPPHNRLREAIALTDWTLIERLPESGEIRLKQDQVILDYGGIAKGYAADQMLAVFESAGLPRATVRAGGDVRVGHPPPGATGWPITLHSGFEGPDPSITLAHQAVSTSGDLYQFIEIDGQRYSHILSPTTGLGLTQPIRCSVIADAATVSDAIATALCILGPTPRGKEVADTLGVTAFWSWQIPNSSTIQTLWHPHPPPSLDPR